MTKTGKVLEVLALLGDGRRELRAIDVAGQLGVSSATAYRYLLDLTGAGLIERSAVGSYVLGPAIVELDRQIRIHDPLIAAARDVMRSLSQRTGATVILCRLHGRKVICVSEVRGRLGPTEVSYARGRAMPLYLGATSKVILAHMDDEQLRDLVQADAKRLLEAGLPADATALRSHFTTVRQQRVCVTVGEVDAKAMGLAVALHSTRRLLGSLSAIFLAAAPGLETAQIVDPLRRAGLRIEGRLESSNRPQFEGQE